MKKLYTLIFAGILGIAPLTASAIDIKDILGNAGDGITDMVKGVISTDNIEVKDIAGEWTVESSAVCFKTEDFLKKAGGAAAATMIENKINPYFEKAGLTGGVLTVQTDGQFTFKMKGVTLSGEISKGNDKDFIFAFKAFGKMSVGKITAYVTKSINSMDLMFDADGIRKLAVAVAGFTGNSTLKSATSILNQYDGLCVGFTMKKTGKVDGEKDSLLDKIGSVVSGNSDGKLDKKAETEKSTEKKNTSLGGAKEALEEIFKSRK